MHAVAVVADRGFQVALANRLAVHARLVGLHRLGDGKQVLVREFRIRVAAAAGLWQPGLADGGVDVARGKSLVRRAVAGNVSCLNPRKRAPASP